jgi:hypothetical protein
MTTKKWLSAKTIFNRLQKVIFKVDFLVIWTWNNKNKDLNQVMRSKARKRCLTKWKVKIEIKINQTLNLPLKMILTHSIASIVMIWKLIFNKVTLMKISTQMLKNQSPIDNLSRKCLKSLQMRTMKVERIKLKNLQKANLRAINQMSHSSQWIVN